MPLRFHTTLDERLLHKGVSLRVLRLQVSLASPRLGFVWAGAIPFCVIDRTGAKPRYLPLLESALVGSALILLVGLALGRTALTRRHRQS